MFVFIVCLCVRTKNYIMFYYMNVDYLESLLYMFVFIVC